MSVLQKNIAIANLDINIIKVVLFLDKLSSVDALHSSGGEEREG
jgi:hypothetical protein